MPLLDTPYFSLAPFAAGTASLATYFLTGEGNINAVTKWSNLAAGSAAILYATSNLLGFILSKSAAPEIPDSTSSEETQLVRDTLFEPSAIL